MEEQRFKDAQAFYDDVNYIKALEEIENLSFVQGNNEAVVNCLQGSIFTELAEDSENTDVKVTYFLASVECCSRNPSLSPLAADSLLFLAGLIGSVFYYKKSVGKAKEGLCSSVPWGDEERDELKFMIEHAESNIAESKTHSGSLVKTSCEQKVSESKEKEETRKNESDLVKRLRSYWAALDLEIKRNFMKVSTADVNSYVEGLYGRKGIDALEQVLISAKKDLKWRVWVCRTCLISFSSGEECKNHFQEKHGADSKEYMPQRISKVWSRKILVGEGWKPLDAAAAVEMIKNQLEDVKAFAYEKGWSKEWPLAADVERSKLLKEIQLLLKSLCDNKILSCSVRDWVMRFPVKHFEKLEVSKQSLTDCRLVETPQSICFLECCELNQILDFLKKIKCERDDGTELVCRAVDSFCESTRVKEKIDFDTQFSLLLLDKRLLQHKIARFDDEGTINVLDPNSHYSTAHAHGDYIISWLFYDSPGNESFRFPTSIREHNYDIWLAVLRVVQFTCRTLGTKFRKKCMLLGYNAALTDAKNLCISEDEKRRNLQDHQWNSYTSLLCKKCKEKDATTRFFFYVVLDVLKGASYPTLDVPDIEDYLFVVQESIDLSDDLVLKSIDDLKLVVTNEVPRIDSKMLLIDKSRISLLDDLTRLSVFDYRSYILRPLKELLLNRILDMESPTKEAILLFEKEIEEEEKKLQSKKKKRRNNKITSRSMFSPIDKNKTLEHEPSSIVEPEVISASLKTGKEDSMAPEDTPSGERVRLEISSNSESQERATRDMQNTPTEDLLSENLESAHGEAATRYNSALDMTLKALLNIKVLHEDLVKKQQPFHGNLEERVPYALQDFFSAFFSELITEEGLYSYLLSNLLDSLEEVQPMSSDVAEVVVVILELCHFWKRPERESLVTRLFTLEEYERMCCRKCRRKPNYPEKSSYGIVMAADSIRDLKCAFGNMKFEDILKVIRMEDEMLCDIKTGGCGEANFVHHTISRRPPIFTIVLEWEKNETKNEISETTMALEWEIDISRLYEGLAPNIKYRLVSMIGCGEEGEYICMAYKDNRWMSLSREALAEKGVGNWKSVVGFCGERKIRPEILFYEAAQSVA